MNNRIRSVASRLIAIGLPLMLLGSMVVWTVSAQDQLPASNNTQAQYEIQLQGLQAEQVQIEVPGGFEYAGLAPGSAVSQRADVSGSGQRVTWAGPFPESGSLRFWLAPLGSAEPPASLAVTGADVQAVHVEPSPVSPATEGAVPASNAAPGAVTVAKTVDPEDLEIGAYPLVSYHVVFSNSAGDPVTLDAITDTLPAGFEYLTPAAGDQVGWPTDADEPDIVWEGLPTMVVPANGTLTLAYNVRPLMRAGEHDNSVVAASGSETIGPASAVLEIEGNRLFLPLAFHNYAVPAPVWEVTKSASPTEAEPGDLASYQVTIRNTGNYQGVLTKIEDALPSGFTFVSTLAGSDITNAPSGTTGTISWTGSWTLQPGATLTLKYQVTTGGGGYQVNTVTLYNLTGQAVASASSTIAVLGGLPYEENFDGTSAADWEPFTNYPWLDAARWFVAGGVYNYDSAAVLPENTAFDLSLYNAPGAQGWTNYRVTTRIKDVKDHNTERGLTGVFFRGTYQDSGANDGKSVTGYYFYMKPSDNYLYLMRTDPAVQTLNSQPIIAKYYYAPRIGRKHWYDVIIDVSGPNIKIQFGDPENGMVEAFNLTDNTYPTGTVGFAEYYTASRYDYMRVTPLP